MELRNNDFKLNLKDGAFKDFEKVVLSSGVCNLFMPMGFVSSEDGELVSYDCSGYTALSQCNITQIKEALDILEKTFLIISRAGEYLISPSKITLNKETIFYHERTKQIKIAYVPIDKQWASLKENMLEFVYEVEDGIKGNNRVYLEKVRRHLDHNNYYIKDIVNLIGELKRQIHN